jgi:hypothetical protein
MLDRGLTEGRDQCRIRIDAESVTDAQYFELFDAVQDHLVVRESIVGQLQRSLDRSRREFSGRFMSW